MDVPAELLRHTQRSNELHFQYARDSRLREIYQAFIDWQLDYLLQYFEDMQARPDQAAAVAFIISDLAGVEISQRDQEFAKVVPMMVRLLPKNVLASAAAAMRLNASVLENNLAICQSIDAAHLLSGKVREREYAEACRCVTSYEECMELVGLTVELGHELQHAIEIPMIGVTLKAMRGPARLAGIGALQSFLETGFRTFAALENVDQFLSEIEQRMERIFRRIYRGPISALAA
ncbi:MAG TPA: hypothetical protein VIS04_06085 [Woeseiaceae bacterium]